MALIDLGTRLLNIGDAPVTFDSIEFKEDKAYSFTVNVAIERPNNVFSQLLIRGIYDNDANGGYYTHHLLRYPISTRPFIFLFPFSKLYGGDGDLTIVMERVPLIKGGSDDAGDVQVMLTYDDNLEEGTWLR